MALRKKRIEIFRAGRHTASDGRTLQFTAADLDKMVANYDPAVHAAPLVIGHPKDTDPSFGRVQSLTKDGDTLGFEVDQVKNLNPDFAQSVNRGEYDAVSVSLYMPGEASNPKPDGYYIRHVGFLGAVPPAIKGLQPAAFGDDATGTVTINFSEADFDVARTLRSLRDWFVGKFGLEEADKALPAWQVDHIQEATAREGVLDGKAASFAEGEPTDSPSPTTTSVAVEDPQADGRVEPTAATEDATTTAPVAAEKPDPAPDAREAELKKREEELARREAAALERERQQREQGHKDFCERLVREGRPLPVAVDKAVSFLCALDGDTVSFGESDTRTMSERFREDYLAKLPQTVEFRELAAGGDDEPDDGTDDLEQRRQEIIDYQEAEAKAGRVVTTSEAARATSKRSK